MLSIILVTSLHTRHLPQSEGCLPHLHIWGIVSFEMHLDINGAPKLQNCHTSFRCTEQLIMLKLQLHFLACGFYPMQLFVFNLVHNEICFRNVERWKVKPSVNTFHVFLVSDKWYAPSREQPIMLIFYWACLLTGPLKQCHPVSITSVLITCSYFTRHAY